MKEILNFLAEPDGKKSFMRLSAFLLVIAYVSWASYIVITEKKIPDVPQFLFWLVLGLYGVNKFAPVLKDGLFNRNKAKVENNG